MSEYTAEVLWVRDPAQDFLGNRYSRRYLMRFDGGIEVPGSSAPSSVPLPMSDAQAVDPEEAFVASLSSCHMLWFLDFASRRGFSIDAYHDEAIGTMAKNAEGKLAMTLVILRPKVAFSPQRVASEVELQALHHAAHEACFIASSVRTEVRCEPVLG